MGGDVGVARRSSRAAVGVAEGGCELGFSGTGSGPGGPGRVVVVAMFSSDAGARRRTWEASPSEHKKWVEVGVQNATVKFWTSAWPGAFQLLHWYLAQPGCSEETWTTLKTVLVNEKPRAACS